MKLTKYGHACVVLEEQGKKLIIDPGGFSPEFGDASDVVAVVVTHAHHDHFNSDNLQKILTINPEVKIFAPADAAEQFQSPNMKAIKGGDTTEVGPFKLEFVGDEHALIHKTLPRPLNSGVLVNEIFFYPGDSYVLPGKPVRVLAAPGNAPWMKVGESMDYITEVKPALCFPTHNGLLSEAGHQVYNAALQKACAAAGAEFRYLAPGESIDI